MLFDSLCKTALASSHFPLEENDCGSPSMGNLHSKVVEQEERVGVC